jgi:3-dehydroquinate dehydratase II
MNILIINGPNLNLLGKREPSIYGNTDFDTYLKELKILFPSITISYFQSNHEGEIIDKLHEEGFKADGIVINAGAYTHTSVGIADAIKSITTPVIEVHISNVFAREEFRHHSFLSPVCMGVICGFGMQSYQLALQAIVSKK